MTWGCGGGGGGSGSFRLARPEVAREDIVPAALRLDDFLDDDILLDDLFAAGPVASVATRGRWRWRNGSLDDEFGLIAARAGVCAIDPDPITHLTIMVMVTSCYRSLWCVGRLVVESLDSRITKSRSRRPEARLEGECSMSSHFRGCAIVIWGFRMTPR